MLTTMGGGGALRAGRAMHIIMGVGGVQRARDAQGISPWPVPGVVSGVCGGDSENPHPLNGGRLRVWRSLLSSPLAL
jgi:hypothetical protein